jgi:WD40 repeat protein
LWVEICLNVLAEQLPLFKTYYSLLEEADEVNLLNNGILVVCREVFDKTKKYKWLICDLLENASFKNLQQLKLDNRHSEVTTSPNNKILAGFQSWQIWFWDLEERQWLLQVNSEHHLHHWGNIVFRPDSEVIALSGYSSKVHILQIKTATFISDINVPGAGLLRMAFSDDGKFLAVGSATQNISLHNLETDELVQNMLRHGSSVHQVAFREDGTIVSSSYYDPTIVWASRLTELCERPLKQNEMRILRWMSKQLNRPDLTAAERGWLEFTQAMLHLRWRYAVEIETDAAYKVRAAPADIEL